jgi:hypothetical protein
MQEFMSRIEQAVIDKIKRRAEFGENKYQTSMERTDLSKLQWMIHHQEELMDACIYVQKLIEIEQNSHAANYE